MVQNCLIVKFTTHNLYKTDVNECTGGSYSCPANTHCVNTVGSYTCECNAGYFKNGGSCQGKHFWLYC